MLTFQRPSKQRSINIQSPGQKHVQPVTSYNVLESYSFEIWQMEHHSIIDDKILMTQLRDM